MNLTTVPGCRIPMPSRASTWSSGLGTEWTGKKESEINDRLSTWDYSKTLFPLYVHNSQNSCVAKRKWEAATGATQNDPAHQVKTTLTVRPSEVPFRTSPSRLIFLTPRYYFLWLRLHSPPPLLVSPQARWPSSTDSLTWPRPQPAHLPDFPPSLFWSWTQRLRQREGGEGCDSELGNGSPWSEGQRKKWVRPEATRQHKVKFCWKSCMLTGEGAPQLWLLQYVLAWLYSKLTHWQGSGKWNGTHHVILVRSQLRGVLLFLFYHQLLIQVADNKRRVIPVLQDLVHISLDSAEHFNALISYKTLLDLFVQGLFHRYFFALHEEILVNFTN